MITPITSPRQTTPRSVADMMRLLLYCLCPGIALSTWFFGIGLVINIALAVTTAVAFENLALILREKRISFPTQDLSAVVTGVLFAITIPIGSHWALVVAGIGFAILIAKHAYGGLGQNLFNPAMCGYLFLLLSFPISMTTWHVPIQNMATGELISPLSIEGIRQSFVATFPFLQFDSLAQRQLFDGMTMATPLVEYKMASPNAIASSLNEGSALLASGSGTGWEMINIAYLIGGVALLGLKVIRWQIPVSIVATIGLLSILFYAPGSAAITGTPYMHLLGSATMLGAFFIATDPVSAATTNGGRIAYGIIIGISIYCIRVWGSYLDAVAIAVIFGNFWSPLLDHFLKPRVYGHNSFIKHLMEYLR